MIRSSIITLISIFLVMQLTYGAPTRNKPDTLDRKSVIRVDPFRLQLISPSSGIQFFRNGIVFLSNTGTEDKMVREHVSFGRPDVFFMVYNDTIPGKRTLFSAKTSFEVPCEGMTFSSDYTYMYYTKRISRKDPEKIYHASYKATGAGKRDWVSDSEPINICRDKFTYSHPALSADGMMMVFTSNRTGTAGGLDLFITRRDGNNWSDPQNAGKLINTAGDEFSPYLDQDNNLFFSSDGHTGSGGFDLYICRYNGTGWDQPANLTEKINTENDEIALTLDRAEGTSGFFSRRLSSGRKRVQLYRLSFGSKAALNELTNISRAIEYIALGPAKPVPEETSKEITRKQDVEPEDVTTEAVRQPADSVRTPAEKESIQPPVTENVLVFRVQFASNKEPRGSHDITVGGNPQKTFEYLYNGLYRSCAGEFGTAAQAANFQKILRQEGYKDAFVVAFRNNVRTMDLTSAGSDRVASKPQAPAEIKPSRPEEQTSKPSVAPASGEGIIYRVQFATNSEPKGSFVITVGGSRFMTFEYFYNGAYRSCAGEFDNLKAASALQSAFKKQGFADAFVVAFRNNVRSLDPSLFR